MIKLLSDLYIKAENLKGKKLLGTLLVFFIAFILIGWLVGYAITKSFKVETSPVMVNTNTPAQPQNNLVSFQGVVTYVNPINYPEDKVSYYLADKSGNELILLKAKDQKLTVAEGLYVTVYGVVSKTSTTSKGTQKDVLIVDRVVVKNASD
jgi:hypothetical protein